MVPRLHKRGTSFKGACGYVLHDPGKASSDRVAFIETRNLYDDPQYAWFEMFDTYRNRSALKLNAGVDMRGRDNKAPVLHYTLSWHADDNPDPDHMRAMAFASLEALGLSEHQAIIVGHNDKEHCHLHVVANTVHPYTGKTAPLKFSKLEFSKWAEAYEKEHGIHCLERIKNNERRRELANEREAERREALHEMSQGHMPPAPKPYEPVRDHSPNRRQWFERTKVVDKMKALRAALDQELRAERAATAAKQKQERDGLDRQTKAALDAARAEVKAKAKPHWCALYRTHRNEEKHINRVVTHPLERTVYVFRNRERLGDKDKPLTLRQMIPLFVSGRKLNARVQRAQRNEKAELARKEKRVTRQEADKVYVAHREKFHALRDRHQAERKAEREHHEIERKGITFARARQEMLRELDALDALFRKQPANTSLRPPSPPAAEKPDPNSILSHDPHTAPGVPVAPTVHSPEKASRLESSPPAPTGQTRVPPGVPVVPMTRQTQPTKPGPVARDLLFGEHDRMQGVPTTPPTSNPAQPSTIPLPETRQHLTAKDALMRDKRVSAPSPAAPVQPAPRPVEKPKHELEPLKKVFRKAASPEPEAREKPQPDLTKTFRRWRSRNVRRDFDRER